MNWRIRNTPSGAHQEGQDQTPVGVRQAEVADRHKQGHKGGDTGDDEHEQDEEEEEVLPREVDLRECISGHGAEQQIPEDAHDRDEDAVEEDRR